MRSDDVYVEIVRKQSYDTRKALSSYLKSYGWDCWFTATFANATPHARVAIDRVTRSLCTFEIRDKDGYPYFVQDNAARLFVAAEPHYLGNWHCHGLIKALGSKTAVVADSKARLNRLGFNVVAPANSLDKVSQYLSKYVTKAMADWDLTGNWRRE